MLKDFSTNWAVQCRAHQLIVRVALMYCSKLTNRRFVHYLYLGSLHPHNSSLSSVESTTKKSLTGAVPSTTFAQTSGGHDSGAKI